jgi:hypothetical protein
MYPWYLCVLGDSTMNSQTSQSKLESKRKTKRVIVSLLAGLGVGLLFFVFAALVSLKALGSLGLTAEPLFYLLPLLPIGCVLPISLIVTGVFVIWLLKYSEARAMGQDQRKGRLFATGLGLLGFVVGLLVGIALFDSVDSSLSRLVDDGGFLLALFFPPLAGICLGGVFTAMGAIGLYLSRRQ